MRCGASLPVLRGSRCNMIRLLVIRHGYTVTNAEGRYTGQLDAPLTAEGEVQAERLGTYLAEHEVIDRIYASDLSRAIRTAAPTAARFGLDIIPMPELREIDVGEFTGMTFESIRVNPAYQALKQDAVTSFPGGESFVDLYLRTEKALERILAENTDGTVMLVTHAGNVRCFSCMAAGDSYLASRDHPAIANTAIDIYQMENGKLTQIAHEVKEHLEVPTP